MLEHLRHPSRISQRTHLLASPSKSSCLSTSAPPPNHWWAYPSLCSARMPLLQRLPRERTTCGTCYARVRSWLEPSPKGAGNTEESLGGFGPFIGHGATGCQ